MPKTDLLYRIDNFLNKPTPKKLNLHFNQLDIFSFYQGQLLNVEARNHGHLVITKTADPNLMNMKVMDQYIFSFSFQFFNGRKTKMLNLPKPLGQGHIHIKEDRFVLYYTIESPNKDRQVHLCYVYQQLQ